MRRRDPAASAGLSPFRGANQGGRLPLSVCLVTNSPLVKSLGSALERRKKDDA
jgi:hypothetical protein